MKCGERKRDIQFLFLRHCTCKSTQAHDFTRVHSPLLSSVSRGGPPFRLPKTTSRRPSYGNSPAVADAETYSAYVNPCVFTLEPRQIRSRLTKFPGIHDSPLEPTKNQEVWCKPRPIRNNQFDLRFDCTTSRPIFHRTAKRTHIYRSGKMFHRVEESFGKVSDLLRERSNRFHPKGRKMDGAYFQREALLERSNFIRSTFARLSSASRSATFFFLTAWDGITWEFFHDLRVSRGEIRALFSFFFFFLFPRNRIFASKNLKFRDASTTTLFAFRAQFQESTKRERERLSRS